MFHHRDKSSLGRTILLSLSLLSLPILIHAQTLISESTATNKGVPRFTSFAQQMGPEDSSKTIDVTIHLKLHSRQVLDQTVTNLYDPASASYQRWLTPQQFHQQFSPTSQELEVVKQFASSHNLHITATDKGNHFVRARGTVADVESAFQVQIQRFALNGKTYRANTSEPKIQGLASTLVASVGGLSDYRMEPRIKYPLDPKTGKAVAPTLLTSPDGLYFEGQAFRKPETHVFTTSGASLPIGVYYGNRYGADITNTTKGHLPPQGYSPNEIQTAFGLKAAYKKGLDGSGQTIVIVDAYGSPTIQNDLATFSKIYGLPAPTASNFQIYYPSGQPATENAGWAGETTLDVEWAHAIAPCAKIALVIAPTNYNTDLQAALSYAIENGLGNSISNSYGGAEALDDAADLETWNGILEFAAATGISVNFSSGDDGDFYAATGVKTVSSPSDSPFATSVGGTSLALASDNSLLWQTGWGNNATLLASATDSVTDPPLNLGFIYGAGGGESSFFAKPRYQKNLPGSGRQQPDIAQLADPYTGTEIILTVNGAQYVEVSGGTSLAAPLFSAEWALANQYARRPLGQAAQVISRLPSNALLDVKPVSSVTNPAGTIFDKSGVSFYSQSALVEPLQNTTRFYSAFYNEPSSGFWYVLSFGTDSSLTVTPGWDNVTGWGTPNGLKFIQEAATH